jgi:hypothetical protein
MKEKPPQRWLRKMEEHIVVTISTAATVAIGAVWSVWSEELFRRLLAGLGGKGIVALLGILLVATISIFVAWLRARKKEVSFFDRLIPIHGAGYSMDPKNGEFACPKCASQSRRAYLAHHDERAFYCQACDNGFLRHVEKEKSRTFD